MSWVEAILAALAMLVWTVLLYANLPPWSVGHDLWSQVRTTWLVATDQDTGLVSRLRNTLSELLATLTGIVFFIGLYASWALGIYLYARKIIGN